MLLLFVVPAAILLRKSTTGSGSDLRVRSAADLVAVSPDVLQFGTLNAGLICSRDGEVSGWHRCRLDHVWKINHLQTRRLAHTQFGALNAGLIYRHLRTSNATLHRMLYSRMRRRDRMQKSRCRATSGSTWPRDQTGSRIEAVRRVRRGHGETGSERNTK